MSSRVQLIDVVKKFGDFTAVDHISIDVEPGSFFSLLGPSGCGKSTTLRILSGFEHPDQGGVRIDGEDVTRVAPYERPTNMVFQRWALFPHMTVANNVAFGLEVERVPRSEITSRVAEVLSLVGLSDLAARKPGQLSGGQMQRVALARALVKHPKVLLLDEPLGALDLKLRNQMQLELKRIQREIGTTFIYVTHDQGEAMTMSDQIAVMNNGRIEQIDAPEAIYDRPCSRFVAGFIGNTNLLAVDVIEGATKGGTATVQTGPLSFPASASNTCIAGTKGWVSLRHERIAFGPETKGLATQGKAVVKELVFHGASVLYILQVEGIDEEITVHRSHVGDTLLYERGTTVSFGWPADAPLLFNEAEEDTP